MIEQYASLVLAEKITRGEPFNEGMEIALQTKPPRTVKASKEIVEAAARTALERHDYGFELSESERKKIQGQKKPEAKPGG
jgi:hypothetical protein